MARLLHAEFGTGAKMKKIPGWCFDLGNEHTKTLVESYAMGDGYRYRNGKYWRISTVSVPLANGVALLANKLGYSCSVNIGKPGKRKKIAANPKWTENVLPLVDILIRVVQARKNKVFYENDSQNGYIRSTTESHYRGIVYNLEVEKDNSYVTPQGAVHNCYHEHYYYFSLMTIMEIFERHGLEIFDVDEIPEHGGSLRIYAIHKGDGSRSDTVAKVLEDERPMRSLNYYRHFQLSVVLVIDAFIQFLIFNDVVAYGAAAKASTFFNTCRYADIPYVVDRSPHKQGKYLPGSHIEVVNEEELRISEPEYVLITAWNLKEEIMKQLSYIRDWNGKFVVAIPRLEIL